MSNSNTKYEFKGTKGPLVIWGNSLYTGDNIQTTAGTISGKNLQKVAECDISELEDDEECIHNLELFAAALALLSALIKVVEYEECEDIDLRAEWYHEAKQAIEQALNIKP